jgi:hypothetical protein
VRALLARWLVEEREWPDIAAEVAARAARLERRQAQRRVREISQTVAQSEATGATTDFIPPCRDRTETARIRADAGVARRPGIARTSRRRTHVHERRSKAEELDKLISTGKRRATSPTKS